MISENKNSIFFVFFFHSSLKMFPIILVFLPLNQIKHGGSVKKRVLFFLESLFIFHEKQKKDNYLSSSESPFLKVQEHNILSHNLFCHHYSQVSFGYYLTFICRFPLFWDVHLFVPKAQSQTGSSFQFIDSNHNGKPQIATLYLLALRMTNFNFFISNVILYQFIQCGSQYSNIQA